MITLSDPTMLKFLAYSIGFFSTVQRSHHVSITETDSLLAANCITRNESLAPEFNLVEDISELFGVSWGGSCRAISRLANGAVYTLARHALALNDECF
ncbi:hypothetical protein TIFTF001_004522 [Ficus carica]|uniref:Uncharacterized protein n=1 Tax=Ficus carica TaxID=3494 RepID=A0AA88CTB4_FICCA|nr:hypothetical protein TIFTF001_004522 [Ficus carica]